MNLFNSSFNSKGQFFSPDLIIALGIFLFTLALFWGASNFVFAQVDLFNSRIESDEVAHSVLNNLILSSGEPINWDEGELVDVNSFGLVHSNNFLDSNKTVTLINLLNSQEYGVVKYKLGAGKYDLELSVVDSKEEVVSTPINLVGGRIVLEPVLRVAYTRIVYYNEQEVLLRVILSIED